MFVEVAQFKANPGVSDEKVLVASQKVHDNYLSMCKGFVSRELLKSEDGTWMDVVHFETFSDAKAATDNFPNNPSAKEFDSLLDVKTAKMMRFKSLKKY